MAARTKDFCCCVRIITSAIPHASLCAPYYVQYAFIRSSAQPHATPSKLPSSLRLIVLWVPQGLLCCGDSSIKLATHVQATARCPATLAVPPSAGFPGRVSHNRLDSCLLHQCPVLYVQNARFRLRTTVAIGFILRPTGLGNGHSQIIVLRPYKRRALHPYVRCVFLLLIFVGFTSLLMGVALFPFTFDDLGCIYFILSRGLAY